MHMLFAKRLFSRVLPIAMAVALTACDSSTSQDGPVASDGLLVVSPPTLVLNLADPSGMAVCAPGSFFSFFPVVVTTFDGRGFPLGNADIALQLDFAPNTTLQVAMSLFDSTGTIQLTAAGSPLPFETQTDEDGTARFQLLADTSIACSYSGSLTVTSGSLFSFMQITATGS